MVYRHYSKLFHSTFRFWRGVCPISLQFNTNPSSLLYAVSTTFPNIVLPKSSMSSTRLTPNSRFDDLIVQSPNDKRKYRLIVLGNGLRALLISDTEREGNQSDSSQSDNIGDQMEALRKKVGLPPQSQPKTKGHQSSHQLDVTSSEEESEEDGQDNTDGEASDIELDPIEVKLQKANKRGLKAGAKGSKKADLSEDTEKLAAAALCVSVGSFSDPPELPGLAHFLEHMVFMGSEKYPDENAFDSFVRKHGGNDNAYTDFERTVFYFDVERKHYHTALDMFAQFFISPLMKKDSINREIKAVDSEWESSKQSDSARKQQLLSHFALPASPMTNFSWGNEETLKLAPERRGINPYQYLQAFHKRYYSGHMMTLAVQAKESLDTLEEWVMDIFSAVPHNKEKSPTFYHHQKSFATPQFTKLYKMIPVKTVHQVELTWNLPCLKQHYESKPLHYLGWLVGHEGKGSILSYLRNKLWALRIGSGNGESGWEHNTSGAMFSTLLTLTDQGLEHVYEVLTVVFEYLEMLKRAGPQQQVFDEIKVIEDNEFRWKDKTDPSDYVEHLVEAMQSYKPERYLTGDSLMFKYDPALITECLSLLQPHTCNIIISSKSFEDKMVNGLEEDWYKTKYSAHDLPAEYLEQWSRLSPRPELCLPKKNDYIPTDFNIKPKDPNYNQLPKMVANSPQCQVWYKQDKKFKVPKGYIYFQLRSPTACNNARARAIFDLFLDCLSHNLQEVAYAAHVSQMEYEFKILNSGLTIKINGFSHKLHKLFETIVDHISDFDVSEDLFTTLVEQLKKSYHNHFLKPDKLARDIRLRILENDNWTRVERRHNLRGVTRSELMAFAAEFKRLLFMRSYIHGNFTLEDALRVDEYLRCKLGNSVLQGYMHPVDRVQELPDADSVCRLRTFYQDDKTSHVVNYYQSGPVNIKQFVTNELLTNMMDEPCFDVLRTRLQLGYHVYTICNNTSGIAGITIGVGTQASNFSVQEVDRKIEEFLLEFVDRLENCDVKEFESQRDSLISTKQCDDSHMGEEVDRIWVEIRDGSFLFNRLDCEIDELEKLTLDEVKLWFLDLFEKDSGTRKKLSVQLRDQGELEYAYTDMYSTQTKEGSSTEGETPERPPSFVGYCNPHKIYTNTNLCHWHRRSGSSEISVVDAHTAHGRVQHANRVLTHKEYKSSPVKKRQVVGYGETEVNEDVDSPPSDSLSYVDESMSLRNPSRSGDHSTSSVVDVSYDYQFLAVNPELEPNCRQILDIAKFKNNHPLFPVSRIMPDDTST